jgi:Uma2 family endonuclease
MVTLAERALRLDVNNYHRLRLDTARPTELIDGRIVEMNPIGTAHRVVVTRLQQQLDVLNRNGRLLVGQPLRIPDFDEPQPDLMVLHRPQPLRPIAGRDVALVIEVSDSTVRYDRTEKLPRYLAAGIERVWIVNIAIHQQPRLEQYVIGGRSAPLIAEHGPVGVFSGSEPTDIDLDVLFIGLAGLPYDEPSDDPEPLVGP